MIPLRLLLFLLSLLLSSPLSVSLLPTHPDPCSPSPRLSCSQIRQMPLLSFVGAGMFKAAYLTEFGGVSYIMRLATHLEEHQQVKKAPYRSFPAKRGTFRNEWIKLVHPKACHNPTHPILFGYCDANDLVADIVEPIIPMSTIESVFMRSPSRFEWWCWPLKWILDILDMLSFLEGKVEGRGDGDVILIEPMYYYYKTEFGMSTISGVMKQPDLGQFNISIQTNWVAFCCAKAPRLCSECMKVDAWRLQDCNTLDPRPEICDDRSKIGYSRMTQRFIMETIMKTLYAMASRILEHSSSADFTISGDFAACFNLSTLPPSAIIPDPLPPPSLPSPPVHHHIHRHSISRNFTKESDLLASLLRTFALLFEEGHFTSFPSADVMRGVLSHGWTITEQMCTEGSFDVLLKELVEERERVRLNAVVRLDTTMFLQNILGRPLQNRVEKYPMNPKYSAKRLHNLEKAKAKVEKAKEEMERRLREMERVKAEVGMSLVGREGGERREKKEEMISSVNGKERKEEEKRRGRGRKSRH